MHVLGKRPRALVRALICLLAGSAIWALPAAGQSVASPSVASPSAAGPSSALGLVAEASTDAERLEFDHLGPDDGLSVDTVYSLAQDRVGFLWIGTEGGLNRYDGNRFKVFRHNPNDPSSLASDDISFIHLDEEDNLWLATWGGGLDRFDPVTETFHHHQRSSTQGAVGLQDDRIQHIFEDSEGVLWVGTLAGGLSRFDRAAGTFQTFRRESGDPSSLCHNRVWRIAEDRQGTLWVGTGEGLCAFDKSTETFTRYRHDPNDPTSLSNNIVRTLWIDHEDVLWAGTAHGLNRVAVGASMGNEISGRLSFERFEAHAEGLSHDVVTALYEDSRGTFWVGTRGGGLNILTRETRQWQRHQHNANDPTSLSDNDIRAILEDRSGVLWVATRQGGLNKLDLRPTAFENALRQDDQNGLEPRQVRSFTEDESGRLWVGTAEGIERFDPERGWLAPLRYDADDPESLPSGDVHVVLRSREGELWFAAGPGLHRQASDGTGFVTYQHDVHDTRSLASDQVTALHQDGTGALWVGTDSGLDRLGPAALAVMSSGRETERSLAFEHFRHREADRTSLSEDYVTVLHGDHHDTLWVGTHDGGLNRFDLATRGFERFVHDPLQASSLSNDRVLAIHQQGSGRLWVGTASGLNEMMADGSFRRYLESDGLPHAQVTGILGDGDGHLWLSTADGLARLDPRTGGFRSYSTRDGLRADYFNPGASLRRRDGGLCFGGKGGYNCFDPQRVADSPVALPVVLTAFERFGESVIFDRALWAVEDIRLSYEDTYFAFEFAALDYRSSVDTSYRYKLEGFDHDWIEAGEQVVASYANVRPGRYLFRAQRAEGNPAPDSGLAVSLVIAPPFWMTPWFRGLSALAILFAGGLAYNFRIRHLRRREQELSKRLEERLVDLRRSEARYRQLFERNLAGVVRADRKGVILECNDAMAKILGYDSPQECQDKHRFEFEESSDIRSSLLAGLQESGNVVGYQATARTRDGSIVSLMWNASLVIDDRDDPAVIEGTVIDVSESRRIEEGLRRTQKLESLGVLAGGIAHDFNNLLMSILGNAELGRLGLDPGSTLYQRLGRIEESAQRAADLSRQMLAYSGKGEFVVTHIDLSLAVREMEHLLEGAVTKKAQLVYQLDSTLPAVEADSGQIEQIVMGLVANASEALGGGEGTISVSTGVRELSLEDLAETYLDDRLPAGSYVYLQVEDNGSGMDEEIQRKIFDPFFTTKFTGRGLGLAAVLGIVRGHHGAIKIDSVSGRGSVFTVMFPAATERGSGTIDAPPHVTVGDQSGSVLVVDDDESVRLVASEMVKALGFEVMTANDGRQGLEVFRQHMDQIELVILDLAMPRMSGEEAFLAIREVSPSVPVILASGYDEIESKQLFAGQGLSGFIQKPYRLGALKEKIQSALDG